MGWVGNGGGWREGRGGGGELGGAHCAPHMVPLTWLPRVSRTMAARALRALLPLLTVSWCARAASTCQLAHDWRPQSEACRAELAEIIVFARVLSVHKEPYSLYNYLLPWQEEAGEQLFFSAEIELLCDQAWGSMLEVPAGSRFNVTGLGYFPCYTYSVVEDNNYYFFLR